MTWRQAHRSSLSRGTSTTTARSPDTLPTASASSRSLAEHTCCSRRRSAGQWRSAVRFSLACSSGGDGSRCLVELDRVAVGVIDHDLLATRTGFDLVPEMNAGLPERVDASGEVVHVNDDPGPSSWFLLAPVRHRTRAGAVGAAQDEAKMTENHRSVYGAG